MVSRRFLPAPISPFIYLLFPVLAIIVFAFATSGCQHSDLPRDHGDYAIQNNEIRFDGQNYVFRWIGHDGAIHPAKDDDVKMVQDESTFLRVDNSGSALHLSANQSIGVDARDNRGSFGTLWYPFFFGSPFGGGPVIVMPPSTGGDPRTPTYRYPPTDTFGRGDSLGGSVPSSRPTPPDYTRVPNARDAVGGQSGGTGGGAAATGKDVSPAGGQSGGVGSGSAASSKGGFQAGPSAYSETRGSSSSSGGGGATGAGSAGALQGPSASSGAKASPAKPSTGSKGIGGARSGGGRR
jgi:hypothetical protein